MRRYYPYGRFSTQFIIIYWLFRGPQMVANARAQRRVAKANPRHAEVARSARNATMWVLGGTLLFYILTLIVQG